MFPTKVTVAPTWRFVKAKPLLLGTAILSRVRCRHDDWAAAIWDQAVQWQAGGVLVVMADVVVAVIDLGEAVLVTLATECCQ